MQSHSKTSLPAKQDWPVILISGASSGLGAAMAKRFSQWATVYGTTRTDSDLNYCRTLRMDVTDGTSVIMAVQQITDSEGRIDVLINNAGVALSGAAETTPINDVIRQFEVNCFGAMRVTQAVLPLMRQRGSGAIINIGSMAGSIPMPYRSGYAASKAALENWSWALRLELRQFGLGVCCVQPGDCQTDLSSHGNSEFSHSDRNVHATDIYAAVSEKVTAKYVRDEEMGLTPEQMAGDIERVVRTPGRRLRFRYTTGVAGQRYMFGMRRCLTDRMLEMIIRRIYSA